MPTTHIWHIWLEFSQLYFFWSFSENMKPIKSGSDQDLHFLLFKEIISWEPSRIRIFWFVCFLLSFSFVVSANIFAFCFVLFCSCCCCFFIHGTNHVYCTVMSFTCITSTVDLHLKLKIMWTFFILTLHFQLFLTLKWSLKISLR